MTSMAKTSAKEVIEDDKKSKDQSTGLDVQSYLISNYREALKRGDKSAAKSCLLAARYFSVNDPNVTNEIYMMAKSDGDVGEASKCFTNIFNDLFVDNEASGSPKTVNESTTVINQVKEEIRLYLNELKTQSLKLKSTLAPGSASSRQPPSVNQSPLLSPRLRLSSEDRAASRDSVSKLDSYVHSSTKSLFYQQLFENLPEEVNKRILAYSIDSCDNPFERCRLMMLSMSIFSETSSIYGSILLRTLIDLSEANDKAENKKSSLLLCRYAKSLLVLDAIPMVLALTNVSSLEVELEELFDKTLNFYSEFCLETSASEYEFNELHEGLKKSIAARILGKEQSLTPDDIVEDNLIVTLDLLSDKYLESLSDTNHRSQLVELRKVMSSKGSYDKSFELLYKIVDDMGLKDVPDDVLFAPREDNTLATATATATPPKSRGRPKKVQPSVIVSPDEGLKRHLQGKVRESQFVFFSILKQFFHSSANYLKQSRTRILLNFKNPIAEEMELELSKSSSQRTSRSKGGSQQSNNEVAVIQPAKKAKLDQGSELLVQKMSRITEESPLNSEHSRSMDKAILANLSQACDCIKFLKSNDGVFKKLWERFVKTNKCDQLNWYRRVLADSYILTRDYPQASEHLWSIIYAQGDEPEVRQDPTDMDTSTMTVTAGSSPVSVSILRALTQCINCYALTLDSDKAFNCIDELLSKIRQSGLLNMDDSYSTGNIMDEYMVLLEDSEADSMNRLGFLFFDTLSIMRYCVDFSIDILKRFVASAQPTSDTVIGHTIVLSQFDWPKESHVYNECINWIRVNKPKSITPQCLSAATKFTYQDFFHYVRNSNIIEDFMAILRQGYTLDIKSANNPSPVFSSSASGSQQRGSSGATLSQSSGRSGSSTRSSKVITTRGVNKTFKEDLKVALVSQMKSSSMMIPLDMISEFLKSSLLSFLRSEIKLSV